jgi:hypothetical protein
MNGKRVLACGATTTVAARADLSASSGGDVTVVVSETAPLSSALAFEARGRDRLRQCGGRRDDTDATNARPRCGTGSFRDGATVAEADGGATEADGIASVSRRAHAGTPASA